HDASRPDDGRGGGGADGPRGAEHQLVQGGGLLGTADARGIPGVRAALYARVSLDRQDYEQQLAGFSSYCLEMGYTPAGEYLEKITGTRADRPEYQRLLADATAGKFERVVCRAPDRFGRDAEEAMFQYLDLKRRG